MSVRAKMLRWRATDGEDVADDVGEADFAACPRMGEFVKVDGVENRVVGVVHLAGDKRHNVEIHF